jgi:hypothetical protein
LFFHKWVATCTAYTEAEKALFEATGARVEAKKIRMKVRAAGDAGLSETLIKAGGCTS